MSIAVAVLAAGSSRRLGRPKQHIVIAGETLLERAVRIAQAAALGPVFAVVRPNETVPAPAIAVRNEHAEEGIAASIRAAAHAANAADGLLLMTCDQILVTSEHLRALCIDINTSAGSGYAGKVGIPAYFPAKQFPRLLELQGDTGARQLLHGARVVETEALAFDVDTEDDLRKVEALLSEQH